MNDFSQILETVNIGLVILDKDLKVRYWNRWMESQSGISSDKIIGAPIFEFFPSLNTPKFLRSCKSVLAFVNFSFFSQKLHHFLFPFKPDTSFESMFTHMQQSCTMGPMRGEDNVITSIYLIIQDMTELATYELRLLEMNMMDGLTGIYNRRFLEKKLTEEFDRHNRYARRFSIIMFDIDFFKKVNDTYGHQCGDFILKSVSSKIASIIRKSDSLARYGGEEFCCLLPETDMNSAAKLAERFRIAVEELPNTFQDTSISVTISLGVAEMAAEHGSAEMLLKKADEALYAAKRSGRNRVVAL